jgi:signal transduction histidine kinase
MTYTTERQTTLYQDTAAKQKLAQTLAERLSDGDESIELLRLARDLAEDGDWQIRYEVAQLIGEFPAADLTQFAEVLTGDSNAYVQRAAQKALKVRLRHDRDAAQRKQKQTCIARQLQKLQSDKKHPMAKQVSHLCRQHGEELIGQFTHDIRGVSAQLRTGVLELLKVCPTNQSDVATMVRKQLTVLGNLNGDWQRYSDSLQVEKTRTSVQKIIDAAILTARQNVEKRNLDTSEIVLRVEMNIGLVASMQGHLIEIALMNLIQNAFESFLVTNNKLGAGEIRVRANVVRDMLEISVTDNGPGMSADELSVVSTFLPGHRNRAKPFSTGFGLPIASRNVVAHDGKMEMTSSKGIGTQVAITLPLNCEEEVQR